MDGFAGQFAAKRPIDQTWLLLYPERARVNADDTTFT